MKARLSAAGEVSSLGDHALIHALIEGRQAYDMLVRAGSRAAVEKIQKPFKAWLQALEHELCVRGLSSSPA